MRHQCDSCVMTPQVFAFDQFSLDSPQEYDECLKLIEEEEKRGNGVSDYPTYVKGLIKRQQGS